jgi:hypothetical protein
MRPAALRIALLALLIGVLAPTMAAHAQARLALVVGNNAYESVPKLERATNDSREVAGALQAMGFAARGQVPDLIGKTVFATSSLADSPFAGPIVDYVYFESSIVAIHAGVFEASRRAARNGRYRVRRPDTEPRWQLARHARTSRRSQFGSRAISAGSPGARGRTCRARWCTAIRCRSRGGEGASRARASSSSTGG